MGTVCSSDYSIDFTNDSIRSVAEELQIRDKLRKETTSRINTRIAKLEACLQQMAPESLNEFRALIEDSNDLDYESFHYGRAQMYEAIATDCPRLLKYIVLNVLRRVGLVKTTERIQWSKKWASYQLLYGERLEGKTAAEVSRTFGGSKASWSRIENGEVARGFAIMTQMANQGQEEPVLDDLPGDANGLDPDDVESLSQTTELEERTKVLGDQSEDWAVARKVAATSGLESALEFLRMSNFSEKNMNAFINEMGIHR